MSLRRRPAKPNFKLGKYYRDKKLIYEVVYVRRNNIDVKIISGNTIWSTGVDITFDKHMCRDDIELSTEEVNEIKAQLL